jgi:tetratricopeptide (TPR) repeat protein
LSLWLILVTAFAQPDPLWKTADSLYQAGNYAQAQIEFLRCQFFNQYSTADSIYFRLGQCMRKKGAFEQAIAYLQKVPAHSKYAGISKLYAAWMYLYRFEFTAAEQQCLQITNDSVLGIAANLLLCIAQTQQGRFEEANLVTKRLPLNHAEAGMIDSLFYQAIHRKAKSPTRALWLSIFLPGSGQIYVKKTIDGITSAGLTAATVAWGIHNIHLKLPIRAVLSSLTLFQQFYEGGGRYAYKLTNDYNTEQQTIHAKKIVAQLLLISEKYRWLPID